MRPVLPTAILAILALGAVAIWGFGTGPTEPVRDEAVERAHEAALPPTPGPPPINYIEVTESCGPHFEGECLAVRSGPGSSFPSIAKARNGVVLAVATTTATDQDGRTWYRIVFDEWIRYPERVSGDWYVAAEYTRGFNESANEELDPALPKILKEAGETFGIIPGKRILVDRSEQKLYAYEGDELFMETAISTGLDLTPTPRGTFTIYKKTPSRYMQGPLPGISDQYYDLPGVPWNMYFTNEGGAIHGAYWHTEFGKQWSHGCVNMPLDRAHELYEWAPLGTKVVVQD